MQWLWSVAEECTGPASSACRVLTYILSLTREREGEESSRSPLSRQVQSRDSEPAATKTGTGPLNENLEPLEGFSHHLGGFLCTRWKVRSPELPWLTNVRKRAGLISEIVSGKRVVWLCVTKEIDNQDLQLPFLHHPWPRFVISKQINKNLTSTCVRDLQILFGFLAIRNHASKDTRGCDCTQSRWPFKSLNLISCQN